MHRIPWGYIALLVLLTAGIVGIVLPQRYAYYPSNGVPQWRIDRWTGQLQARTAIDVDESGNDLLSFTESETNGPIVVDPPSAVGDQSDAWVARLEQQYHARDYAGRIARGWWHGWRYRSNGDKWTLQPYGPNRDHTVYRWTNE